MSSQKLFPFWRLVAPTPTLVERITNGGFETGDFTGWIYPNSAYIDALIKHSGMFGLRLEGLFASLEQDLVTPTAVNDIVTFTIWIYGQDVSGSHSILDMIVHYTDDTIDDVIAEAPDGSFLEVDCVPFLTKGKTIDHITVRSNSFIAPNLWADDVSLKVYA